MLADPTEHTPLGDSAAANVELPLPPLTPPSMPEQGKARFENSICGGAWMSVRAKGHRSDAQAAEGRRANGA